MPTGTPAAPAHPPRKVVREILALLKPHWVELAIGAAVVVVGLLVFDARAKFGVLDKEVNTVREGLEVQLHKRFDELNKQVEAQSKTLAEKVDNQSKVLAEKAQKSEQYAKELGDGSAAVVLSNSLLCGGEPAQALATLRAYLGATKVRDTPAQLRRSIAANLAAGYVGAGELLTLREADLADLEDAIFQEAQTCSEMPYFNLSCCYLAAGNRGRAKRVLYAGIERALKHHTMRPEDFGLFYAAVVLVGATEGDGLAKDQREKQAWDLFQDSFGRAPVPPDMVHAAFDDYELANVLNALRASQPPAAREAVFAVRDRLKRGEVRVEAVIRELPNGKQVRQYIQVSPKTTPPPEKVMPKKETSWLRPRMSPVSCCQ